MATSSTKSIEEFTVEPNREEAERSLAAEAGGAACPCPLCRSQDVAREHGRPSP
jgi:hypothetical protein